MRTEREQVTNNHANGKYVNVRFSVKSCKYIVDFAEDNFRESEWG